MILHRGGKMKILLMLALLPICYANECMEAVQETCQEVIIENNEQLLETMEGMVANSTCDASNFVFDDDMKNDLILRLSDEFKEEIKIQIAEELREDFKAELLPQVKSTLKVELKAEFRHEFREEFMTEMKSELKNELKEEMREEVKNELKVEVKDEFKEELGEALKEEFEDNASKMADMLLGFLTKITNSNFVFNDIEEIKSEIKEELVEELSTSLRDDLITDLSTKLVASDMATEVSSRVTQQANEDLIQEVEYLKQLSRSKMARTCAELSRYGFNESGEYEIDPDGPLMGHAPIVAFCNFTTNATEIRLKPADQIDLEYCENGSGCSSISIEYQASMQQIKSLMDLHSSCSQKIVFSCNFAPLQFNGVSYGWWSDREGNNQTFGKDPNCECGEDDSCIDSTVSCNCNSKMPELLSDIVEIDDKSKLPVTGFHYGPFTYNRANAAVAIHSLICSGKISIQTSNVLFLMSILISRRARISKGYNFVQYFEEARRVSERTFHTA